MTSENRLKKQEEVKKLKNSIESSESLFIIHYKGLSVTKINNLRAKLSNDNHDIKMQVVKNSLMKLAIKDTNFANLDQYFTGPTAVIFAAEPVSIAKILKDYGKSNEEVIIIGAGVDNKALSSKEVDILASMPSLDESRATIIGLISAPAQKIANITSMPARQLAMVLNAYSNKN